MSQKNMSLHKYDIIQQLFSCLGNFHAVINDFTETEG